jgi:hypothetical protein
MKDVATLIVGRPNNMRGKALQTILKGLALVACFSASAANYPCSGRKGGVSHCMGQYFVCNDGTTSQSKKICSAADAEKPRPSKKGSPKG